MAIILSLILAVVGYFVLIYLSVNSLGYVVRGFFKNKDLTDLKKDEAQSDFIRKEAAKLDRADTTLTIISIIFLLIFLYLLYRYVNLWAILAALILMVSRLPSLLFDIKHGKKATTANGFKGPAATFTSITMFVALPIFWYSIYLFLK